MERLRVVLGVVEFDGSVLFQRRNRLPYLGMLALPGGRIEVGESEDMAMDRELREEAGLSAIIREVWGRHRRFIKQKGKITHEFNIGVYCIVPSSTLYRGSHEGEIIALPKDKISCHQDEINPFDLVALDQIFSGERGFETTLVAEFENGVYKITHKYAGLNRKREVALE